MKVILKNGWEQKVMSRKSSKKVTFKLRLGLITVFDLYFTIGVPGTTITFMNYTWKFIKTDYDNTK